MIRGGYRQSSADHYPNLPNINELSEAHNSVSMLAADWRYSLCEALLHEQTSHVVPSILPRAYINQQRLGILDLKRNWLLQVQTSLRKYQRGTLLSDDRAQRLIPLQRDHQRCAIQYQFGGEVPLAHVTGRLVGTHKHEPTLGPFNQPKLDY